MWPNVYIWPRKYWLNFGNHPLLDPELGIFWSILQHFSTVWLVPGKTDWIFPKSLSQMYLWVRMFTLKFGSCRDPPWWRYALVLCLIERMRVICCWLLQILTWRWASCVRHHTHCGTSTVASTSRAHKSHTSVSPSKSPLSVSVVSSIGGKSCLKPASLEYLFHSLGSLKETVFLESSCWTRLLKVLKYIFFVTRVSYIVVFSKCLFVLHDWLVVFAVVFLLMLK